jgi:cell volume regulation protein A
LFLIDKLILLTAVLVLSGIASSKLSARLGLPVLVMFLIIGMLAGEAGPGGIDFDNANVAHALGTLALALILFDGGLQTPMSAVQAVWKPAAVLATAGVVITAVVTGYAAAWILELPLLEGMLLGAIVASTDAAAVFALLRNAGIHINARLKATLEIESATNDPMAVFLTIGFLEILVNEMAPGTGLLKLFVLQMGIGSVVGLAVGWVAVQSLNRVHLAASGLYPVMVAAFGLLAFGLAANLEGSGYLAIFLAGLIIGNSRFVFQRSTFLFHDGLAWLSQIIMFVMLGLLVNPHNLFDVWLEGLAVALVLIFISRPLAVWPLLGWFGFSQRDMALVSWVGLRGSVPIILAIFPLIFGLPNAYLIFNVVFFVVLISATLQGSTLSVVARALGLTERPPAVPAATLEITALSEVDAEIVEYTLGTDSRAADRAIAKIALPDSTVVAMITRGNSVIAPRGSTLLREGDHLFVVLRPANRVFVDRVFSESAQAGTEASPERELCLKGATTADEIRLSYGLELATAGDNTLEQVIKQELGTPAIGGEMMLADVRLRVNDMVGNRVTSVGLLAGSGAVASV